MVPLRIEASLKKEQQVTKPRKAWCQCSWHWPEAVFSLALSWVTTKKTKQLAHVNQLPKRFLQSLHQMHPFIDLSLLHQVFPPFILIITLTKSFQQLKSNPEFMTF